MFKFFPASHICDIMGNFHHRYWLGAAQVSSHFPGHQAPNLPLLTHSSYPVLNPNTVPTPFRLAGSEFHVLTNLWLKKFFLISSLSYTALMSCQAPALWVGRGKIEEKK